jgi:hypothetical protein
MKNGVKYPGSTDYRGELGFFLPETPSTEALKNFSAPFSPPPVRPQTLPTAFTTKADPWHPLEECSSLCHGFTRHDSSPRACKLSSVKTRSTGNYVWILEVLQSHRPPVMTEHTNDTLTHEAINTLLQNGIFEGIPLIAEILANAAMILERARHLKVGACQRGEARDGQANGFKPRGLQTSFGKLHLNVPQVRGSSGPFQSSLFEKGCRTDPAIKVTIAKDQVPNRPLLRAPGAVKRRPKPCELLNVPGHQMIGIRHRVRYKKPADKIIPKSH